MSDRFDEMARRITPWCHDCFYADGEQVAQDRIADALRRTWNEAIEAAAQAAGKERVNHPWNSYTEMEAVIRELKEPKR